MEPSTTALYRRLLGYLRPHMRLCIISIVSMIVYGASDGILPYLLKRVLDDVFVQGKSEMLWMLVWVLIGLGVLRAIFGFFQEYLTRAIGFEVVRDMRNQIGRKFLVLDAGFFHRYDTGNLMSRVTNDTLLVNRAITEAVVTFIKDSIRIVALMVAAFWLDPFLAAIAFVGVPLGVYPIIRYGKKVKKLTRAGQDQLGGLTATLHELILGHRVIQAFGLEKKEAARFEEDNTLTTKTNTKAAKYDALSRPTNEVLASVAIAAIVIYGGTSVIEGVRTQGDFIAFLTAMLLLYEPLKKMGKVHNTMQAGLAAAERVFEIIDMPPTIEDSPNAKELAVSEPHIEFAKVSFSYPSATNESVLVLKNISLSIAPGETVALVGMSGGGKSTLVNLLPRFYDVTAGAVRINGEDIRGLTLDSLRKHIAIVTQNTFLFNDTVYNNIANGRPEATEAEVHAAARAANAAAFIEAFPEGYNTMVGEQGLRLSGGQRARIAIARALLRNAPILILDEATASLDSESEELVQAAIEHLMHGRTSLVIAHRLATIKNANRIAVIVEGQLVELGTHEELIARDGEYAKLYHLQFGRPAPARRVNE